ncbi:hypothetical protein SKAU_G00190840 [Synaphobranchus kaupii]|uniref:Myb/SANT-like DNA-binding domain-containing protein n=1 Tax=Synaphobranchus kaupii TaxID=118154 RepID=A0A9Q1IXD9_SYNKA|nr:hypothetical protein SKAU_G00190840 [Synaphobranchus kaupii]
MVLSNTNTNIIRMTAPRVVTTDTDATTVASRWKWDDEMTKALILWRGSNQGLFTGHRNAATRGFETWVKEMELEGKVTVDFLKKKWENLKKKYKDCKNPPTGRSMEGGEATAANWKWYEAMDDMLGESHSINSLALGSSSGPDDTVLSYPSEERATTVTSPSTSHSESPSPSTSTASAPAPKKAKKTGTDRRRDENADPEPPKMSMKTSDWCKS